MVDTSGWRVGVYKRKTEMRAVLIVYKFLRAMAVVCCVLCVSKVADVARTCILDCSERQNRERGGKNNR